MLVAAASYFVAVPVFATVGRRYLAAARVDFSPVEQLQRRFPSVVSVDLMIKEQPQRRFPSVVSVDQAAGVRILSAT